MIKLLCEVLDGDVDPLCNMQPKLQTQKTKPNNFPRQVCIFRQNLGGKKITFFLETKLFVYNFRFLLEIYLNGVAKGFLKFSSANLERFEILSISRKKNYVKFYFDSIWRVFLTFLFTFFRWLMFESTIEILEMESQILHLSVLKMKNQLLIV